MRSARDSGDGLGAPAAQVPAGVPVPRGDLPRSAVEQRALADTALLMAGLGLGSALLAWAVWARLGWTHPPAAAVAAAVTAAVAARGVGGLGGVIAAQRRGPERPAAEHEASYVGLVFGWALVAGLARWRPADAALAGAVGCLAVWAAWLQAGRLWRDLVPPPDSATPPEGRLRREDLAQPVSGEEKEEQAPGEHARGAVGGWWAVSGLLAVFVPVTAHGRALPVLAVAGVGLEAVCGGLLVARGLRMALMRRAAADGARVMPEFSLQAASALLAVLLCALFALALPAYPTLPRHALGQAIARSVVPRGSTLPPGLLRGAHIPPTPPPPPAGGAGGRLGVYVVAALALALLAVLLVLAVRRLLLRWSRGRGLRGIGSLWWFLGQLLRALWESLAALWSGMLPWCALWAGGGRPRRPEAASGTVPGSGPGGGAASWWARGNPRTRVRAAYRAMLAGAAARGHRRPSAASPRGFARQISPALPPTTEEHGRLTTLYEEARYSQHPVSAADAADAAEAARTVVNRLRPG